jgi:hypothetical protein
MYSTPVIILGTGGLMGIGGPIVTPPERMGVDILIISHVPDLRSRFEPNRMAAAFARGTSNAALLVMGYNVVRYNPLICVAEESARLDVRIRSGGPAISMKEYSPARMSSLPAAVLSAMYMRGASLNVLHVE